MIPLVLPLHLSWKKSWTFRDCHKNFNWDDQVPEGLVYEWVQCKDKLPQLMSVKAEPENFRKVKKDSLSYALEDDYGQSSYVRMVNENEICVYSSTWINSYYIINKNVRNAEETVGYQVVKDDFLDW